MHVKSPAVAAAAVGLGVAGTIAAMRHRRHGKHYRKHHHHH
ncbi:hypothetical protein SAMN05421678_11248 [Actinopolymorpha cephalotaxi]|uniref:Uncharacterized protein n=1 Tax=Actinopolymorpha cephalotaxi TaxID=504797 RepID=A0A1I2XAI9_9ACTN|nr:hypothetical protein [Actinopolymorpha cephalotaxi]NYH86111.1 hypothetical protein [Actinopolymorpha cephalotaxi]SFH09696.1 hypothetical protein SAMN05421678_11248 [Actinopolymorpha cephalotaxi]